MGYIPLYKRQIREIESGKISFEEMMVTLKTFIDNHRLTYVAKAILETGNLSSDQMIRMFEEMDKDQDIAYLILETGVLSPEQVEYVQQKMILPESNNLLGRS